jgi:hypothetical protein
MNYQKIKTVIKEFYQKLLKINDSPQKIALGLGLGVFFGIMPGMGPLAALFLAYIFRVNRAAALLGSLLTNTWLSFVTFSISLRVGSFIMNLNWYDVYHDWLSFLEDFHWLNLFKLSIIKIIFPLILGYFGVSFLLGILSYIVTLTIVKIYRPKNKIKWM